MSLYLGTTPIAVNSSSREIGEIIQSTIPLTDAGLHLLDGSVISGSGSYSAFVTHIAGLVSSYPNLFTTEANWQSSVSIYGVCGKFVYDSVNNTVRLPKITGFIEGTVDSSALGDLVNAGLPNITGQFVFADNIVKNANSAIYMSNATGCFSPASVTANTCAIGGVTVTSVKSDNRQLIMNASRSSSIYGNSTTVQPQSIKVLYYIVIANSVKTNIEVDIDEVMTDLNGKADTDLSNVNASGTSLASGWSMPSSRYIDLTLGASGSTYTAPANGWFGFLSTAGSANAWIYLTNESAQLASFTETSTAGIVARGYVPAKKGQIVSLGWFGGAGISSFVFIYAEGEN